MITKFLNKLKSILFKSSVTPEVPVKKAKKTIKKSNLKQSQKKMMLKKLLKI